MKSIVHKSWFVERDDENKVHGPYAEVTRNLTTVTIKFLNKGNTSLMFTRKALPQLIEIFKEIVAEEDPSS